MDIANNIKRRRMELGISQEELAAALGYKSRSTIAKIESGQNDVPLSKLVSLAHYLDVSVEVLLTGNELSSSINAGAKTERRNTNNRNIAVILAGGKSSRNLQNIPNQFINVLGKPVIVYCLEIYQNHPLIDEIYVVCQNDWRKIVAAYSKEYGISKIRGVINAGFSGIGSIKNAVSYLEKDRPRDSDIVVFQESTRPFVTEEMISKLLATCQKRGSAIICESKEDNVQFMIEGDRTTYLDRTKIVDLQSPDAHTFDSLRNLFEKAKRRNHRMTESCIGMLMANLGMDLHFCEGNHNNLKIVRQEDIAIFSALLKTIN